MKKIIYILLTFLFASCTKDIVIDTQEGPQLVGINGCFTNELKKHQIVISKTADFYSEDEIEMISDAEVYIYDGFDTIYFKETENKGYYETIDSVAGIIGRTYNLYVCFVDEEGEHNYYSQSTMRENVNKIDSLNIKDIILGEYDIPGTLGLYPYFQSVADPQTTYLVNVSVNDSLYNNSLIRCQSLSLGGFSGVYFNSPEMIAYIGEQPIYYFFGKTYVDETNGNLEFEEIIKEGDSITMFMYSITPEFSQYITGINTNLGSNPMIGMPSNVITNIHPKEKSVGFFEALSVVTASITY